MPRFRRLVVPQFPHHVTQRGNARRDVFFSPQDRQVYLGLLKQYSEHYSLQILGYCLMTNHVHLVAVPGSEKSLSRTLREVNGRYARYRNSIEHTSGHLWQGRFYSCAFEEIRLAAVMRYVELNPVRAGMVRAPEDYAWSSALIHLGGQDARQLLAMEEWQRAWPGEEWAQVLREGADESASIREATHIGRPFGAESLIARLEEQLQRRIAPGKSGRPRKQKAVAA